LGVKRPGSKKTYEELCDEEKEVTSKESSEESVKVVEKPVVVTSD